MMLRLIGRFTVSQIFIAIFLAAAPALGATTYHVDSTNGDDAHAGTSPGEAFKTLDRVSAIRLQPGDRVLFAAGSRFTGALKLSGTGAKDNPILISSSGQGPRPRIDGEGVLDAVLLENMQYVEISGLEITNKGAQRQDFRTGIKVLAQDSGTLNHIVLRDLFVHDVNGSLEKSKEGCGIFVEASGETRSRFDGLLIEGCHVVRTDRNGICMRSRFIRRGQNWYPSLKVVIRGNLIEDCGGDCIKPWGCEGALVEHNVVKGGRMRCEDYAAGIWPWSSDNTVIQFNEVSGIKGTKDGQSFDCDYNCYNTLIQYNYSHDNEGGFLLVCGPEPKNGIAGTENSVIRFNISLNDGFSGARVFHISGGAVKNTHLYNNVIHVKKVADLEREHVLVKMDNWSGWPTDTFFRNNIFYVEGTVSYSYGEAKNTVFENNCFFGIHQNRPPDTAAILSDPGFVNPVGGNGLKSLAGYMLRAGSPCLGAAAELPHNGGRDFWNNPLGPRGPKNVGAFEGEPAD